MEKNKTNQEELKHKHKGRRIQPFAHKQSKQRTTTMAEHKIEKKNLDESRATMAELKLQGTSGTIATRREEE